MGGRGGAGGGGRARTFSCSCASHMKCVPSPEPAPRCGASTPSPVLCFMRRLSPSKTRRTVCPTLATRNRRPITRDPLGSGRARPGRPSRSFFRVFQLFRPHPLFHSKCEKKVSTLVVPHSTDVDCVTHTHPRTRRQALRSCCRPHSRAQWPPSHAHITVPAHTFGTGEKAIRLLSAAPLPLSLLPPSCGVTLHRLALYTHHPVALHCWWLAVVAVRHRFVTRAVKKRERRWRLARLFFGCCASPPNPVIWCRRLSHFSMRTAALR